MMKMFLAALYWNHSKFIFYSETWPIHVTWYGFCFALGVLCSSVSGVYLALSYYDETCKKIFSKEQLRVALENFAVYSILFIVPGARIAYILFYGGDFYFKHPEEIFKVWHGGLASHGGMIGLVLWALIFSYKYRKKIPVLTLTFLLDLLSSVFGGAAFLIRIGNFMNQEIVGKPTKLPWGVLFSSPMQGYAGVPVHPVQLYEGVAYLILASCLFFCSYRRYLRLGSGWATAFGLMGIAVIRFGAEFFKSHQGTVLGPQSLLTMGQILSIPVFVFGFSLAVVSYFKGKNSFSLKQN